MINLDPKRFIISSGDNITVVLDMLITQELREEGICNELIHKINGLRKDNNFNLSSKICIYFDSIEDYLINVITKFEKFILSETQGSELHIIPLDKSIKYVEFLFNSFKENTIPLQKQEHKISIGIKQITIIKEGK